MFYSLFFFSVFTSFGFSQNSNEVACGENPMICSIAPKEFVYYVDFVKEMLSTIVTVQWKWKQVWQYNYIWWLFSNKVLQIPWENQSILNKMITSIQESISRNISTALGLADILWISAITSYKDIIWLSILFQSRPIVRDWKTLLDLETSINNVFYELSVSAMSNQQLLDHKKFQEVLTKYTNTYPLFEQAYVSESTKYKDVLHMLVRLNWAMKTFVPYGKISQFDEFKKWWQAWIYVRFNSWTINDMKLVYSCARFFKCNNTLKDLANNVKLIWSDLKRSWNDSKTTIKDANKRLWEALKWFRETKIFEKSAWEKYLTDTEIELLRNVYRIDTSKLTKQQWISLRDLLSLDGKWALGAIKFTSYSTADSYLNRQARQGFFDQLQEAKQERIDRKEAQSILEQNAKKLEWIIASDYDDIVVDFNLVDSFYKSIIVVNSQQKDDLDILLSTNSLNYLAYYTSIWYRIREVMDLVWNKDKNMVMYLRNTCELQCSNKWIDWCYVK